MHRRAFLLSSSALALTFAMNVKLLAAAQSFDYSEVPIGALEKIHEVHNILDDYRFGIFAKANIFDADRFSVQAFDDLRPAVHEVVNLTLGFWERMVHVTSIRRDLTRLIGPKISDHIWWLGSNGIVQGYSCRDMMETGSLNELSQVAKFVEDQLG